MAEDLKNLARRVYATIGGGDLDQLDELMVPEFVDHNPDPGQGPGGEGVKEGFRRIHAGFPDLKATPAAIYVDGDTVIARVRVTGTHNGEFQGIALTGRSIDFEVIDIVRAEQGKAAERWGLVDGLRMMQKLGQTPAG